MNPNRTGGALPDGALGRTPRIDRRDDFIQLRMTAGWRGTARLKPPIYQEYLPTRRRAEYRAVIHEFFNDADDVAKHLRRDNLFNVEISLY